MYKKRLRPALEYYKDLTNPLRGYAPSSATQAGGNELSKEFIEDEMQRLLTQIGFFQHERLVHLIVTVLFALGVLIVVPLSMIVSDPLPLLLLGGMMLILLIPYIVHYFHLENGVQQLYIYYNKLELMADPERKPIY